MICNIYILDSSELALRVLLLSLMTITVVLIWLFILREFFYAYRHVEKIQLFIPKFLIKHNIISLEDWELTDREKNQSEDLIEATREWIYRHDQAEYDQLKSHLADNFHIYPYPAKVNPWTTSLFQRVNAIRRLDSTSSANSSELVLGQEDSKIGNP